MSFYLEDQTDHCMSSFGPTSGSDDRIAYHEGEVEFRSSSELHSHSGASDINIDTADTESGVEPDSSEWIFQDTTESVEFDITAEQAMATLRYFASTAERANMLTKTHHDDLDVISSLLQEKEKDLEMAARIGQSLLQRNKQLLLKIEAMEDYITSACEKENQMRHEVSMKNDLLKRVLLEEQEFELMSENSGSNSGHSYGDESCKDESIILLEKKCRQLESQNKELFEEAVSLKDLANETEKVEKDLVVDCLKQLSYAKDQITHLTDEIALKFEDNVAQQDEITQLISTVVELQRKQKQLSTENEDLQYQLEESQQGQECLRSQVICLERRLEECCELLKENQDEVKTLRTRVESVDNEPWTLDHFSRSISQHDSLALEIEESVKRELTASDRNKDKTSRVLETVRKANRFLSPGTNYSHSTSCNVSSAASLKSQCSIDSDDRSESSYAGSQTGSQDLNDQRRRKGYIPAEKLQIVKPMEGSITLHKWHHLASENVVAGLNVGNVLTPQKKADEPSDGHYANSLNEFSGDAVSDTRLEDLEDDIFQDEDEDFGITFKADDTENKSNLKEKQSTPVQSSERHSQNVPHAVLNKSSAPGPAYSKFDDLSSLNKPKASKPDRSIITRTSSLLDSLREGRAMLNKDGASGKSKADAIDILAHAMTKANVEAKTGQRILESVNVGKSRARSSPLSGKQSYPDMPKLNKVLERLASHGREGKVDLNAVQPALKILLEKAADIPVTKDVSKEALKTAQNASDQEISKPDMALPSLLRGPSAMSTRPGILGSILKNNNSDHVGSSMLSTVLSSNATVTTAKPSLSRSLSSGDLKAFNKDNLMRLGSMDSSVDSNSIGRIRRNSSSGVDLASLTNSNNSESLNFGLRRRTNSSGSLVDLVKQANVKAVSSNSPPTSASFISFDNYGVEDVFTKSYNSSSPPDTTTASPTTNTTSEVTTAAVNKPTGFLRSLFLGSTMSTSEATEVKRPSSVHEATSNIPSIGSGSSASAESGLNNFGKPAQNDTPSGFTFGFMSYFGGSRK